jgi:hypothetical protein
VQNRQTETKGICGWTTMGEVSGEVDGFEGFQARRVAGAGEAGVVKAALFSLAWGTVIHLCTPEVPPNLTW